VAIAAIVLAAGQGTRMKSDLPKVLHTIAGRPMVHYVLDTVQELPADRVLVVVGHQADRVEAACRRPGVEFVLQKEQLGTGHAVLQCGPTLQDFDGTVLVLNGDVPGLKVGTLRTMLETHRRSGTVATVMTARFEDPTGYGRIVRDGEGLLERIVEEKDADERIRAIREVNAGVYCFEATPLFEALRQVGRNNAQGEYYLTDVVALLRSRGERVGAFQVADPEEAAGVNTSEELDRIRKRFEGGRG
jgi:UDP-N-acetylglucosamine diphosphorylase/glucosamine-1-phosphate N-acetyltransferase